MNDFYLVNDTLIQTLNSDTSAGNIFRHSNPIFSSLLHQQSCFSATVPRCCRSFPSLYRKKRQSFTALFMDGNLPRPLGSRQLYLCRDLTPARFISGSSSALRAPDGRSHQRNFHLIIYNGRHLPHRIPGSRTFRPFSRNPLRHRQPSD